ncbi:MAG: hypothetical protein R3F43_15900 [bacterium]
MWLKSQTVTTLTVSVEGSNDGINWSALSEPPSTTAGSALDYRAIEPTTTDIIIPWARVRLQFNVDAGSASSAPTAGRTGPAGRRCVPRDHQSARHRGRSEP